MALIITFSKLLLLVVTLTGCASFTSSKKMESFKGRGFKAVKEVAIEDNILIKEYISSNDHILHRRSYSYTSNETLIRELKEIEAIFPFDRNSDIKVFVTYSSPNSSSLWKVLSIVTLAIVPYWENIEVKYEFVSSKKRELFIDSYTTVNSLLLFPIMFFQDEAAARFEIAKRAKQQLNGFHE